MRTRDNPFSTRYIQPGAIPYQFFGSESMDQLLKRFRMELNWRGAIVGPHGAGKSTLLESFVPRLGVVVRYVDVAEHRTMLEKEMESARQTFASQRNGSDQRTGSEFKSRAATLDRFVEDERQDKGQLEIHWFRLSASAASSSQMLREAISLSKDALLVIDGFEQLPCIVRWWLAWRAWYRRGKLLVTCHAAPLGIPLLYQASISQQSAEYTLRYLLMNQPELADRILSSEVFRQLQRKWGANLRELLFELYDLYEDGNDFA